MGEPAAVAAVPEPLAWQAAALEDYSAQQERDYLLAAWVGVGKTRWALLAARTLLDTGIVARVVVVVHTRYLRRQWRDEAASMGIQLRSRWYNGLGREEDDFQGICTTYQSIAANPEVYSAQCLWKDTLVICDEIHHVADDPQGRWGSALRTAFYARTRGIYLSATPFRTDGAPIPFLRYNGEQVCIPNFVYGYRDALADKASRRVAFAQIEGDLRWLGPHGLHQAIFADPIPSEEDMRRLATALDLRGDWLPAVLAEANERLSQIRHTVQADAGGLVVARDIAHARGIAELLRTITGQEAVVVTSDSRDAEQHISAFDHGRERHRRWIVAVRMISEGVDIRRLYVGVWATDILNSRLFFLQILGRFLRVTRDTPVPWAKQLAWLYIPAVKQLLEYARTVEEMRGALLVRSGSSGISVGANGCLPEHSTAEDLLLGHAYELPSPSSPPQSYGDGDKDDARTKVRRFEPLDATAQPDGLTFQGIRYPMEVVRRAQELCLKKGWEDPSLLLVALEAMEHVSSGGAAASGQHKDSSLEVRKGAVRADITRLTKTLANLLQQAGQGGEGNLYLRLRQQLKGPEGSATERATLSELEQQRRRLSTVVQEGWRALRQGDYAAWVQRVEAGF